MESPHFLGAAEECHSSESGWTMYIGSPVEDEENHSHLPRRVTNAEFDEDEVNYNYDINRDDTSDDSMASDASSGLSHREQSWEIRKGAGRGHGAAQCYENNEANQNETNHCSSNYKSKATSVNKNRSYVKGNEEKGKHKANAKGTEFLIHGSKVRKSHWMGKRK